jgi:putative membrane protein
MNVLARVGFVLGILLLALLGSRVRGSLLSGLAGSAAPIACASVYHLAPLALYTQSWRVLLPRASRPSFLTLLRLRWMGESINALLPVAQVGGDVVRARRLVAAGVPAPDAGASMIGDLATGLFAQLLFTLVGLGTLALEARVGALARPVAAGLAFVMAIASACVVLLRLGVHRIVSRLPLWRALTAKWKGLAGGAARLDASLRALVRDRRRLAGAFLWHLAGWFSQVVETWLILSLAGYPVRWGQALVIESLAATARGAAFFVPGGLGVQEATLVGIGRYLGLPLEATVTLGVAKRLREIVVGLPGVALLAYAERAPGARLVKEP